MSTCIRILLPALFLLHALVLFPFLSVNVIADHHHSNGRGCKDKERQALLKFKNGVADPNRTLYSWKGYECCTWFGVICHNVTGHVIELSLPYPNGFEYSHDHMLSGRIDSSLGDLTHLVHLDLSFNNFDPTPIPIFLGNSFPHLRYLNLSHARFVGDVPPNMGNLSNLRVLDLNFNWGMTIGNIGWLSHLSSLQYMDLSFVKFPEKAPWFEAVNKLSSLRELRLRGCNLENIYASYPRVNFTDLKVLDLSFNTFHHSALPDWMSHITNLERLDVTYSNFTGPIPSYLGRMSALQRLRLGDNNFLGYVPESLWQLSDLVELDISYNALEGNISELHFSKLAKLESLDMSGNSFKFNISSTWVPPFQLKTVRLPNTNLHGSAPEWLWKILANATYIDLSNNKIRGELPAFSSQLEYLDLSNNSLSGSLPNNWEQYSTLEVLDLSNNGFSGTIPSSLGNLTELQFLSLQSNSFSGSLPNNWEHVSRLWHLDLSNNGFSGTIPSSLGNLTELEILSLQNNSYSGSLPNNWEQDSRLWYLDLSHNGFSGTIPSSFGNLTELQLLILGNNDLSGQLRLPPMKNLRSLNLKSNRFSGKIPKWICENVSNKESLLSYLDLSNNELSGTIPSSFGNLTNLISLYLGDNTLSGQLPLSMKNMRNLQLIDLHNNRLSGKIPSWMGENLSSLIFLKLRSNLFHGEVPGQLSRLAFLQILDVANNTLSGSIPKSFRNFKAMASTDNYDPLWYPENGFSESMWIVTKGRESFYKDLWEDNRKDLDLSMNKFSGNIPEELSELKGLQNLNLSGNLLQGPIPNKIGELRNLESLDLSRNRLSGVIPPSLSALSFMGWFNVSNNNLSGKIPFIGHLTTFENSSYIGNEKLCGPPLSKKCPGDHETDLETRRDPYDHMSMSQEEEDDEIEPWTVYIVTGSAFCGGICSVFGVLIANKSWRDMLYRFSDNMFERFIVAVILWRVRIKRMLIK